MRDPIVGAESADVLAGLAHRLRQRCSEEGSILEAGGKILARLNGHPEGEELAAVLEAFEAAVIAPYRQAAAKLEALALRVRR